MLIRLSKNTFVRYYFGDAYISNQLTRFDRIYNETGADFLHEISRTPRNIDDIVDSLQQLYDENISRESLREEFVSFVDELVRAKFLVLGETDKELRDHDLEFSYKMENPKTMVNNYTQETKQIVDEDTQNMMLEATMRQPRLNEIQFELTSRCNERCIHCYIPNQKKDKGADMPFEQVKSILDEFSEHGGLYVTLSGGEVFLHKDIIKIIQYCREKDLIINILTNLIALKDIQIPFIKAANISGLQVSLYSMNPEVHDMITTVRGSFNKTKKAIEKLVEADIPVMISCPVMKANYKDYKDVMDYAKSLKCKAHTDLLMMAQADLNTNNLANRLSLEETEIIIKDIVEHDPDYLNLVGVMKPTSDKIYQNLDRYKRLPLCGAGINNCCITDKGDVYPCAGWQDFVVGNINENSLEDIWNNSEKLKAIRSVSQGDFPECISCEARDFCARCLVRNYNESNGNMLKINKHFCDVAFLNKRIVEEYRAKQVVES